MKKYFPLPLWLLSVVAISTLLFSCQKDVDSSIPEQPTISSKDPQAVSAAVSVWHGLRVAGTVPKTAASTNLKLGAPGQEAVTAIAGRYAFIKPNVESGNVAGYYVRINGANEYFNVDYTKPVKVSKVNPRSQSSGISTAGILNHGSAKETTKKPRSPFTLLGDDEGFNDSLIVISLPPNIKTPDTLCVTYWAYDSEKQMSNPVTTCIYINHLGGDNDSKWLEGNWKVVSLEKYDNGQLIESQTVVLNQWRANLLNSDKYYKRGDTLFEKSDYDFENYNFVIDEFNQGSTEHPFSVKPSDVLIGTDSILYKSYNLVNFKSDGFYNGSSFLNTKFVDYYASTVNGLKFNKTEVNNYIFNGAWSYNSITKKMIIVEEYKKENDNSSNSTISTNVDEYNIEKISNDKWKVTYTDQNNGKTYVFKSTIQRQ